LLFGDGATQCFQLVANLSLANMDFAEFADNTNPDGVFCGF